MAIGTAQYFNAAVKRIIDEKPHGYQSKFAKTLNMSASYLNDILKGRKFWQDEDKDKVAAFLEMTVADLLIIGQAFLETGEFFPYIRQVSALPEHSEDRAQWIISQTGKDAGFTDVRFFSVAAVKIWDPEILEKYLKSEESDSSLYERAYELSKTIKS